MSFPAKIRVSSHPPMTFDAGLSLVYSATRAAREYWEARRRSRAMPARGDLDHAGMRRFIAHVGLVACEERGSQVDYRVRLAGSEWEAVFGAMTGKLLPEFLAPEIEARWRQVFDAVCTGKAPLRVSTRLGFKDRTWLDAEVFVAPMSEDGERVSMLFLCFVAANTARRTLSAD